MPMIDRRTLVLAGTAGLIGVRVTASVRSASDYSRPPALYDALRRQPAVRIMMGDGEISVAFAAGGLPIDRELVLAWVMRGAQAVSAYFGRWPIARYGLLVIVGTGDRVGHATTFGYAGSVTRIGVGAETSEAAFSQDWVLVHEMFHAALPNLPRRALWLQEGSATWLEPVARAAAGQLAVAEVWRQAIVGMPRGEPVAGEGGMDGTDRHDRLYWGGATFWLLAEISIQRRSAGTRTLRDAMRAVSRSSGGNAVEWTPERLMQIGDRGTGSDVLAALYANFTSRAIPTDLASIFAGLGVHVDAGGVVVFDDRAPLAAIRRRITSPT